MLKDEISFKKSSFIIFSQKVIDYLRLDGEVVNFIEEEKIIKRGDKDLAFYVILSGEVEVRLTGVDGNYLVLARLGENSSFGEMALLREEPVSADVISLSNVSILKYPKNKFLLALSESTEFRMELMEKMAQNVQDTSTEAWSFFQRVEALNMLAKKDKNQHEEPIISRSVKMRKVEIAICDLDKKSKNILIHGEPGTGKLFLSRKIHNLVLKDSSPFIVIDCSNLGDFEAKSILFGSSQMNDASKSLDGFGARHLAHNGTLVLKHIDDLDIVSQKFLIDYLRIAEKNRDKIFPRINLIGTTCKKLNELEKNDNFLKGLFVRLNSNIIKMPSLKDRKADLLLLAKIFLKNQKIEKNKVLSKNAEETLLSLNYRQNNVKELRESVELSTLFCEDGEILSEHIFAGPKDSGLPSEFNIGEIPIIKKIINNKSLLIFRNIFLLFFLGIIGLCIFQGSYKSGIFANSLIWALWEPAIIFFFLFAGRIWCTICPISTLSLWTQKLFSLNKKTSLFIKKYSYIFIIIGIFLIFLSEKVFQMTKKPLSSGILLAILMLIAVLFSIIYKREVWCRYICPLGAIGTAFSFPASLHIRAKPYICNTYCKTHDCYKGNDNLPGCSVFHHPLYISESYNCKLCFRCIDLCPHNAVQVYMRPFLKGIWLFGGFAKHLTLFSLSVFSLSIFMLFSNKLYKLNDPIVLIKYALFSIFIGILLENIIYRIMIPKKNFPDKVLISKISLTLMLLGWGPLMAYQFSNIKSLSSMWISIKDDSIFAGLFTIQDISLLIFIQAGIIIIAFLLSIISFLKIKFQAGKDAIETNTNGWYFVFILTILYTILSLMTVM